jgi:hypothetical protein
MDELILLVASLAEFLHGSVAGLAVAAGAITSLSSFSSCRVIVG